MIEPILTENRRLRIVLRNMTFVIVVVVVVAAAAASAAVTMMLVNRMFDFCDMCRVQIAE